MSKGGDEREPCLDVSLVSNLFSPGTLQRQGKGGPGRKGEFKMVATRRNMYTVQNNSGILHAPMYLAGVNKSAQCLAFLWVLES